MERLEALMQESKAISPEAIEKAPDCGGAYLLAMQFHRPVEFSFQRRNHVLAPGFYVYSGSAYGPGGIRARLRRHFRRDKKLHWHVDRLTTIADAIHAIAVASGSECELVSRLTSSGSFLFPLEGFGSSDCTICRSHLLGWRDDA